VDLSHSELIKKEYGHLDQGYFNSAYFGPTPMSAKESVNAALDKEIDPRNCLPYDQFFFEVPDKLRTQISSLLGCKPDSISLNTSSTDVVSAIAHGINLSPSDVVVSFKGEFPSNVLPWMIAEKNRGLNFQMLEHPLPDADWLLSYIDVMICSTYKWMLGPYGAAFSYFNDRALKIIDHQTGNWITSPNSIGGKSLSNYTVKTLEGARKFDRGQSPNILVNAALSSSFDLLLNLGLENIGKHNKMMSDYFLEIMPKNKFEIKTPLDARGNILALRALKVDSDTLDQNLKKNSIVAGIREGNVRLSFHLFNTKSQIENLVKVLDI